MDKSINSLEKFVEGILMGDEECIYFLQLEFRGIMVGFYREYIAWEFGNSDEDDVISVSLQKLLSSMKKFQGSTWEQFGNYAAAVIKNSVINYRRTLKRNSPCCVSYDIEKNREHVEYKSVNTGESLENIVINKLFYNHVIGTLKLSKSEEKYRNLIEKHGSVEEYLKENCGNRSALNQAGYRLRKKLRKKIMELGG